MEEKLKDLLKILHSKKSDKYYEEINKLSDNVSTGDLKQILINYDAMYKYIFDEESELPFWCYGLGKENNEEN